MRHRQLDRGAGHTLLRHVSGALLGLAAGLFLLAGSAEAATITVTTTNDTVAGGDGCSLREAIRNANNNDQSGSNECTGGQAGPGTVDRIEFNIGGGVGVKTINVAAGGLPFINDTVIIDGYTQPGATANTLAVGTDAVLLIELNGAAASADLLTLNAAGSTVRGLVVNNATGGVSAGVFVNANNITIRGNYIGTDPSGAVSRPNEYGLFISGTNATIGGTAPADRNVISGNSNAGGDATAIAIAPGASNALIQGNYIGTNASGTAALQNDVGILGVSALNLTIGGPTAGARNVISGNTTITNAAGVGIFLIDATNAVIQGNYVGTNASGAAALPNDFGVFVASSPNVTVGGTAAGARNVISGNTNSFGDGFGIEVVDASSTNAVIQGNYIGTNASGTVALPNNFGVIAFNAPNVTVGGTNTGARNIISGNSTSFGVGVTIFGPSTTGAIVQGNYIGTAADGTSALPNRIGVDIESNARDSTVGGTASGAANVIAFNTGIGVQVLTSTGNAIRGNAIHSNGGLGIDLDPNNIFSSAGGPSRGARNVITFNPGSRIKLPTGIDTVIRGNPIHANGDRGAALATAGATPNDGGDADSGSNALQNFPVLAAASLDHSSSSVTGTLNSTASTTFQLDFYASPTCDPSGYGEGKSYLGAKAVTTDATGNVSFIATDLAPMVASSNIITATATSPAGNTSEFSACTAATGTGADPNFGQNQVKPSEDDQDKKRKLTDEQRQQQQHTNASNQDQYHTEGHVSAIERSADGTVLLVTIALGRGETLIVEVRCPQSSCPDIRVGDYLDADGEQGGREEQGHFIADDITVTRNGSRVR